MGKKYVADVFETTAGKNLDTGKVDVSNNNTGSVIDLGNQSVNYYNMDESDDHSFITYTLANIVNGGKARLLVNTPTLPLITGATNIKGGDFQANTDIYLEVENSGGRIEYWVKQIYISPFVDLTSLPFGIVVHKSTTPNLFVGSSCVLKTTNGRFIFLNDYFGGASTYTTVGVTSIYYSDNLNTGFFTHAQDISNMFWGSLFEYSGDIYVIGTSKNNGNITISKSTDNGESWSATVTLISAPTGSFSYQGWAKAPDNVLVKDGYVVLSFEAVRTTFNFASGFDAAIVFGDVSDLMNPSSWSYSNLVSFDTSAFVSQEIYSNTTQTKTPGGESAQKGFLEGSLVELGNGDLRLFMRLEQTPSSNSAVYMDVLWDSGTPINSTISTTQNYIRLYGGQVNYQVKYDSVSGKLWSIVNLNRFNYESDNRIELFLISSDDNGESWSIYDKILGYIPTVSWESEIAQLATSYAFFEIDGDNLIVTARCSDVDASNHHDTNVFSLIKIEDFRLKTPQTLLNGSFIINESSERLEDSNGIAIIHDLSKGKNSAFMLTANNANKPNWTSGGIQFDGSSYLRLRHDKCLNITNGYSVFVVVENFNGVNTNRILSKAGNVIDNATNNFYFSAATGLGIQNSYGVYTDIIASNNYIIASAFDSSNNHLYNYLNGSNRGNPPTKNNANWVTDHLELTIPYTGGNFSEMYIGRRAFTTTPLYFSSKIKAIHIIPEFKNSTDMIAYMNALNAIYSIY